MRIVSTNMMMRRKKILVIPRRMKRMRRRRQRSITKVLTTHIIIAYIELSKIQASPEEKKSPVKKKLEKTYSQSPHNLTK